ncbi:MAG: proline dehydrogenase family protein [Thermodesulfobacteriota bacterium]
MIKLATNPRAKRLMQNSRRMTDLANRFVGGQSVEEVLARSEHLLQQGKKSSLFYLGEYVRDQNEISKTRDELESAIKELALKNIDLHISVDPTQIGLMNSVSDFSSNGKRLSQLVQEHSPGDPTSSDFVMIDMEDTSVTQATLDVYHDLHSKGLPCGVTLQAYLHRTESDLQQIIESGGKVRLVKGAFAEPESIAFTRRKEIDQSYFELARKMLSDQAKRTSFYPVFGTHDDVMIDKIITYATEHGWAPDTYEFEFLLGVRESLQDSLVKRGHKLRLYVPFGTEWWAYSVRRVGESPRNGVFLLRSLFFR